MDGHSAPRSDIPDNLVWRTSFETFTGELDDPFLAVSRLHDAPPVIWVTDASHGRPGWMATRHDVMAEILIDHQHFSAQRPGMVTDLLGVDLKLNPVEYDPPLHHAYRKILQPLFTPRAVGTLDGAVRDACDTLIGAFGDAGGCEFIDDFAVAFPAYVFLDLVGLPRAMLPQFLEWETRLLRDPDPMQRQGAARAIYRYLEQFLDEQRHVPGNDLLHAIVGGRLGERALTHLEMMGMLYVLYLAGLDTVYSTLGWVMRHLASDQPLQDRLRADPSLIPAAVDEFFRAFPVAITYRRVTQDYLFHGAPLREGDDIHVPTPLAGRDPVLYTNPHVIDIDRKARNITFGTGAHICLGVHLAKREVRLVIEQFLDKFRDIRMRDGETYRYHTGLNFGVDYLPLQWAAA